MNWKKILKALGVGAIALLAVSLLLGSVYAIFWFYVRVTPMSVMEKAVTSARQRDVATFRGCFSDPSLRALQASWTADGATAGSWSSMMAALLQNSGAPPEIGEVQIVDERAKIKIRLRGQRRAVYLINQGTRWLLIDDWRIDVLTGIDEGLSPDARKAQALKAVDDETVEKQKELLEEPKGKGWWKKDEK
jgi:hypothetical protein